MFMGLMQGIGYLYYFTWFVWPFVFVFSFAYGLASLIKDEAASGKSLLIAAISLLIILAGITGPHFAG